MYFFLYLNCLKYLTLTIFTCFGPKFKVFSHSSAEGDVCGLPKALGNLERNLKVYKYQDFSFIFMSFGLMMLCIEQDCERRHFKIIYLPRSF